MATSTVSQGAGKLSIFRKIVEDGNIRVRRTPSSRQFQYIIWPFAIVPTNIPQTREAPPRRGSRDHLSAEGLLRGDAAVHDEPRAGHEGCVVRGEEHDALSDIVG